MTRATLLVLALGLGLLMILARNQIFYSHILKNMRIETVEVYGKPLTVEIVSTSEAIHQGLSDRDSMPLDHGMLFVFPAVDRYTFWMHRMRFPLDIIWIRDGRIVEIARHLPPPKWWEAPATHTPKEPANKVLELNAGQAKHYGLNVGSTIQGFDIF